MTPDLSLCRYVNMAMASYPIISKCLEVLIHTLPTVLTVALAFFKSTSVT